ncbi:MAG: hypothetical protein DDT25_01092 [Chloroflexi bacterium]|nr:hypothetical protein [Chloroflexota bacterium]
MLSNYIMNKGVKSITTSAGDKTYVLCYPNIDKLWAFEQQ